MRLIRYGMACIGMIASTANGADPGRESISETASAAGAHYDIDYGSQVRSA